MAETALDIVLVVLLTASILWSARLHRQLARLRTDRAELASFIDALASATARAESATAGLKAAGRDLHRDLARQEAATRQLIDRLRREAEVAGRILRRLDQTSSDPSPAPAVPGHPGQAARPGPAADPTPDPARGGAGDQSAAGRIPPEVMRALQSLR